jgi:uncharacterized protein (TIGR02145 family)
MSKNKAWIQYTKYGEIVPGSLIVSPRRPVNGVWYEVVTDICCDTEPPFGLISSKQKAFVKYDASGNIVPGSLVLTDGRLPKPGIWKEVYINICCAPTGPVIEPVVIGDQTWSLYNLDVTKYRNGDTIPQVTDQTEWNNLTTGAWCYFNNDSANGTIYGKLYNWYAVNDPRGLAPTGWHIPTQTEWNTLRTYLGGSTVAGGPLKEVGTTYWNSPNTGATNTSGFTALGGGTRLGSFIGLKGNALFWTSTEFNVLNALTVQLNSFNTLASLPTTGTAKYRGSSVRLIKD